MAYPWITGMLTFLGTGIGAGIGCGIGMAVVTTPVGWAMIILFSAVMVGIIAVIKMPAMIRWISAELQKPQLAEQPSTTATTILSVQNKASQTVNAEQSCVVSDLPVNTMLEQNKTIKQYEQTIANLREQCDEWQKETERLRNQLTCKNVSHETLSQECVEVKQQQRRLITELQQSKQFQDNQVALKL